MYTDIRVRIRHLASNDAHNETDNIIERLKRALEMSKENRQILNYQISPKILSKETKEGVEMNPMVDLEPIGE